MVNSTISTPIADDTSRHSGDVMNHSLPRKEHRAEHSAEQRPETADDGGGEHVDALGRRVTREIEALARWKTNNPPATPATAPDSVKAVSLTGTGDTENACAASSFSRMATIARPAPWWHTAECDEQQTEDHDGEPVVARRCRDVEAPEEWEPFDAFLRHPVEELAIQEPRVDRQCEDQGRDRQVGRAAEVREARPRTLRPLRRPRRRATQG